jgi:hypothetical protein
LKSEICFNEEVVFGAVVLRVMARTIEREVLEAFDAKDQHAFAIIIRPALKSNKN